MKTIKKMFAMLLAVVMVMGLSVTALADDSYTITINNAANNEIYNAYKIFNATASASTENRAYSYTIASIDAWFNDVLLYMGGGTTAVTANTNGVYTGRGLTLTPSADGTKFVVTYSDDFSVAEFAAFLGTKTEGKTAAKSGTAANATVTLDVSTAGAGYYFVDTSLGSLCSLDTVVGTNQSIYEKNSIPSITKKVKEDDNNINHTALTEKQWQDSAVLDVIDTVSYQLTVNTGTNAQGVGTGVDANYVIKDTLPAGFTYKENTIAVKVGNTTWTLATTNDGVTTGDYTVSYVDQKLTVTLLSIGSLKNLAEDTNIVITYDAAITAASATIGANGNTNNVTLTYKNQISTADAVVKTYELVPTVTVEGQEKPAFVKVDGSTGDALEGVKFILSRIVENENQYAVVENGFLKEWSSIKTNATELTTTDDGTFNVKGLDAGKYILTETETLEGYNLLTDTITVVVNAEGGVTYQYTSKVGEQGETAGSTITVENNTGTELPSTGGIGTTIFYVIGAILVLGAAILLITKKRMSGTEK